MQSIINSIIKYRNLIIYLLLLFFSFNNLYNKSGLHFLKIGNISISIAGFSANIIDDFKSYFNLINENELLKKENDSVKVSSDFYFLSCPFTEIVSKLNQSPIEMLGHVTSSYFSPNLNKSIALAVVKGGKDMMGKKLFVPMENKNINVTVANPVFYDEKNERLNA